MSRVYMIVCDGLWCLYKFFFSNILIKIDDSHKKLYTFLDWKKFGRRLLSLPKKY